ncbi:hypothetical protein [Flammeovirga sp. SJP92]|uniref:hypothetical protein n=1 Tax=Flammeovirga sp. SJP92 TaxID=1775430 RepID=UPI00078791F2|nr:hypothetical protein [Flammeovirga sp. SJP92]KXX72737.1 hypothetical protein AVL50_32065 [Flammeovirga sp. SJP92]
MSTQAPHIVNPYTRFYNSFLQDESLHAEELGILCYLSSKGPSWTISVAEVRKRFNLGKHKAQRVMQSLCEKSYIFLKTIIDKETGMFEGKRYVFSPSKKRVLPKSSRKKISTTDHQENKQPEIPTAGKPDHILNNETEVNNETIKSKETIYREKNNNSDWFNDLKSIIDYAQSVVNEGKFIDPEKVKKLLLENEKKGYKGLSKCFIDKGLKDHIDTWVKQKSKAPKRFTELPPQDYKYCEKVLIERLKTNEKGAKSYISSYERMTFRENIIRNPQTFHEFVEQQYQKIKDYIK